MVVGGEGSFARCIDAPVVPDGGGEGQEAGGHPGVDPVGGAAPWSSRVSWPLRVSNTDSIHCRVPPSFPKRLGSPLRSGQARCAPISSLTKASKSLPAKPLSEGMTWFPDQVAIVAQERLGDFAFPDLGVGQPPR